MSRLRWGGVRWRLEGRENERKGLRHGGGVIFDVFTFRKSI